LDLFLWVFTGDLLQRACQKEKRGFLRENGDFRGILRLQNWQFSAKVNGAGKANGSLHWDGIFEVDLGDPGAGWCV
jgi:hypothetical protein